MKKKKLNCHPMFCYMWIAMQFFFTDSLPIPPSPDKVTRLVFLIKYVLKHGREKKSDKASPRAATPSHMKSQV